MVGKGQATFKRSPAPHAPGARKPALPLRNSRPASPDDRPPRRIRDQGGFAPMTHSERHLYTFLVATAAMGVALAGCAKQPTASLTSAPAPTGLASSTTGTDSGAPVPAKHDESADGKGF